LRLASVCIKIKPELRFCYQFRNFPAKIAFMGSFFKRKLSGALHKAVDGFGTTGRLSTGKHATGNLFMCSQAFPALLPTSFETS
jgi:hypothetical protein